MYCSNLNIMYYLINNKPLVMKCLMYLFYVSLYIKKICTFFERLKEYII